METENEATMCTREVQMVAEDVVEQIRALDALGYGAKRIAREVGLARNTVRRYLRGARVGVQERPRARRLSEEQTRQARALYESTAEGNAVVVLDLLPGSKDGDKASLRTVQRAVAPLRRERRAAEAATVRFETPPGEQMQVDFGERKVRLGGVLLTVYFFVATLGFSRRLFVRASLSQRQDEWLLGLEGALTRFGGRPEMVVVDNARALVLEHGAGNVRVHPAFEAFCRDRGLAVFACRPYRARTKGKVESGVKYVKRNAIAGRSFESLDALERHLDGWMAQADERIHGTTHRRPSELFLEAEAAALRPLHDPRLPVATQRLRRRVANDCFVDVDTVRYSVPHRLARCTVEVTQTAEEVIVRHQDREVARHRRSGVPHERVVDARHFEGLLRPVVVEEVDASPAAGGTLAAFGRSLADYAEVVGGTP